MRALVKNYRQSSRKVRLVARTVIGMDAETALVVLEFMPNRAAVALSKAIRSAIANAVNNFKVDAKRLYIENIKVDEGPTLKRWRPKWRGTAHPIRKRTSRIEVLLALKDNS